MALLIDGYNLLYASGILRPGHAPGVLEKARHALLNVLAESLDPADVPRTTVVFDAKSVPPDVPRELHYHGLTVLFAVRYEEADSLIEELIRHESAPRKLIVVSSDRRLQAAARRRRAKAVDSEQWFDELLKDRRRRKQATASETTRRDEPLDQREVDYWLHEFGANGLSGD